MTANQLIQNLIFLYARKIDEGNFEEVAELFRYAQIEPPSGEPVVGYEAVLAMYQNATRLYEDRTPKTKHITTNLAITVEGSAAQAHSYFTVMQALPQFPLQAIICGRYDDNFEQADGVWRFTSRQMFPELLGDLSNHLLFDLEAAAE